MINSDFIQVTVVADCEGDMGGDGALDGCGDCVNPSDVAGYLDECGACQHEGDDIADNTCFQVTGASATGGMGEMFLSWDLNPNAASYNIYRDGELVDSTADSILFRSTSVRLDDGMVRVSLLFSGSCFCCGH